MRDFLRAVPVKVGEVRAGWVCRKVEVHPVDDRRARWQATFAPIGSSEGDEMHQHGTVDLGCDHAANPAHATYCRWCGERIAGGTRPREVAGIVPVEVRANGGPWGPALNLPPWAVDARKERRTR
jgi:hypothetical protein